MLIPAVGAENGNFDAYIPDRNDNIPFGISGLFRLRNEEEFMEDAIFSHYDWLDEIVLVVQSSADNTVEMGYALQSRYAKIRTYFYPFDVAQINTEDHFNLPENHVRHMAHLTNYGISLCSYSWIAKIEGDVLAMDTFSKIRDAIEAAPKAHRYYGRVGINVAGFNFNKISMTNPRNAGWDEGVFNNDDRFYCARSGKWETINFNRYLGKDDVLQNMGYSFLHLKRCKSNKSPGPETWAPATRENVCKAMTEYRSRFKWPAEGPDCPDWLFDDNDRLRLWGLE